MKRLIDEANGDSPGNGFAQLSGEQRLAVLVQSAEKFQPNPFRRRWVLAQIRSGGRKQGLRLRPWVVAAAGLLVVGSATAGGTAWWRSQHPVISAPRAIAIDQPPVVRAEPHLSPRSPPSRSVHRRPKSHRTPRRHLLRARLWRARRSKARIRPRSFRRFGRYAKSTTLRAQNRCSKNICTPIRAVRSPKMRSRS